MSWRRGLPTLPRGWCWLRYDVRRDLVLAHCCYGLWFWATPEAVRNMAVREAQALREALSEAVRAGVRGPTQPAIGWREGQVYVEILSLDRNPVWYRITPPEQREPWGPAR